MKIEDLIQEIYASNVTSVFVQRNAVKHGNRDQAGDYSTVTLDIQGVKHVFSNQSGTWKKK